MPVCGYVRPVARGEVMLNLSRSDELYIRELNAIRDRFPDWDIIEIGGSYIAVPRAATTVRSLTLDGLTKKLEAAGL